MIRNSQWNRLSIIHNTCHCDAISVRLDCEGEVHGDAADGLPEEQRDHPRGGKEQQTKRRIEVVIELIVVVGQERSTDFVFVRKQRGPRP